MKEQHNRFCNTGLVPAILFLFILMTSTALGQADSALGFFPLHTGDLHQYRYHYSYNAGIPCTLQTYSSYRLESGHGIVTRKMLVVK